MKKYIHKTAIFTAPFVIIFLLNTFAYNRNEGDLIRIGYLYCNPSPTKLVNQKFDLQKEYLNISELNLTKKNSFQVLTIGDSFSNREQYGYQNFLSMQGISILNFDRFLTFNDMKTDFNPIQKLIELINGDFFESIIPNVIILQTLEREIIYRVENVDFNKTISFDSLKKEIKNPFQIQKVDNEIDFFSDATLKIPFTNFQYLYRPNPTYSQTYKFKTTANKLFSGNPDNILVYHGDIKLMKQKNDTSKINKLNEVVIKINDLLASKNIKLIVLISPDKYDLYYPYIKNKENLEEPMFFNHFSKLPKPYIYIPAYEVLSERIKNQKDIYYYDDTHWSPFAAQIIANEITNAIQKND